MIAVLPVRAGRLPAGADAAVAACSGRALVIGEQPRVAAGSLRAELSELRVCEAGPFAPSRWAAGLAPLLAGAGPVVLPGSPDGRDLLGRLAASLGWPAFAWCTEVTGSSVTTTRHDGRASVRVPVGAPFVATLVPTAGRGHPRASGGPWAITVADVPLAEHDVREAEVVDVTDADPAEIDLAEADRIVAGGVGLGGEDGFAALRRVADGLRASLGATRPIADRGIVGHERQIGTTGAAVDPTLYLAFGISGAVQHTAGLGTPERVVAVNTDPACPMMAMADLAVVADARATVEALAARLGQP